MVFSVGFHRRGQPNPELWIALASDLADTRGGQKSIGPGPAPSGVSMDWFKGKNPTGNHRFSHQIWGFPGFPVNFPLNQSIDLCLLGHNPPKKYGVASIPWLSHYKLWYQHMPPVPPIEHIHRTSNPLLVMFYSTCWSIVGPLLAGSMGIGNFFLVPWEVYRDKWRDWMMANCLVQFDMLRLTSFNYPSLIFNVAFGKLRFPMSTLDESTPNGCLIEGVPSKYQIDWRVPQKDPLQLGLALLVYWRGGRCADTRPCWFCDSLQW